MAIQWIFLDMGYTLVNEDAVWRERCREQAATPEAQEKGVTAEMIYAEIENASRAYLPQYRTAIGKLGLSRAVPYRAELERLYPDAPDALSALCGKYSLGVIANQLSGLEGRLSALGIRPFFSMVVSSWEAGVMKPDPALFRLALEKAGCAPEEALMAGDRLDNDVFPAKALGMRTVWVRRGFGALQRPRSPAYEPDRTVDSLSALPAAAAQIDKRRSSP
ncbi:MAG: HAD family hydrolase [Clostridia bacterium]|nr:HAD family hydrolase [Clostridia bacterium]